MVSHWSECSLFLLNWSRIRINIELVSHGLKQNPLGVHHIPREHFFISCKEVYRSFINLGCHGSPLEMNSIAISSSISSTFITSALCVLRNPQGPLPVFPLLPRLLSLSLTHGEVNIYLPMGSSQSSSTAHTSQLVIVNNFSYLSWVGEFQLHMETGSCDLEKVQTQSSQCAL